MTAKIGTLKMYEFKNYFPLHLALCHQFTGLKWLYLRIIRILSEKIIQFSEQFNVYDILNENSFV